MILILRFVLVLPEYLPYNMFLWKGTNFPEWSSVQLMCFLHLFFAKIFVGSGNYFVS